MKKSLISIAIALSVISLSSDYFVVIKKEHHLFKVISNPLWEDTSPIYSNWSDTENISNCDTWLPLISQQKINFSQSSTCEIQQERIKTNRQINTVDSTIKNTNQEIENQTISKIKNRNVIVTTESPLVEKSNYNCETWMPETSTVYSQTVFEQERYCDVDMVQDWAYNFNSSVIGTWQERYTDKTGYETQNGTGTHLENTCLDILNYNNNFLNVNQYYNSNMGLINCDMSSDGGGWTQVANVTNTIEVVESNIWIDNINSKDASVAVLYFNTFNPSKIKFENRAVNERNGQGDLIVVSRVNPSWGWTPSNHNDNTDQVSRFYDNSNNSWVELGVTTYASHRDLPWQDSPFSFTINNVLNGYGGLYENRLILGGTFINALGTGSWYSFYGNEVSMNPVAEYWRTEGQAAIWMK